MQNNPVNEPTWEVKDMGAATEQTRGSALLVPYYENGVPPYDHRWPDFD
jgi:hypothetical protein